MYRVYGLRAFLEDELIFFSRLVSMIAYRK